MIEENNLAELIANLKIENHKLKENWKELKNWLQEKADNEVLIIRLYLLGILNKVEEIEKIKRERRLKQ